MPVYSYLCKKCKNEFELMIPFEQSNGKIECSQCKSEDTVKKFSGFSVGNTQKTCGLEQCASSSCDLGRCPSGNCSLG